MENHTDEFDSLQRLLSLKRHEAPPPRFFDELPGRIMNEIQNQRPSRGQSFLDRLFAFPVFQPVAAAGVALLIGGLFLCAFSTGDGGPNSATGAFLSQQAPFPQMQLGPKTGSHEDALQPVEATARSRTASANNEK